MRWNCRRAAGSGCQVFPLAPVDVMENSLRSIYLQFMLGPRNLAVLRSGSTGDYAFWRKILPGHRSELIWGGSSDVDALPRLLNPPTGFIQNSNDAPRTASAGSRGAVLFIKWAEAMDNVTGGEQLSLRPDWFAIPWQDDEPLTTPRGIADPGRALEALKSAVDEVRTTSSETRYLLPPSFGRRRSSNAGSLRRSQ